jgi:hypothetical protein
MDFSNMVCNDTGCSKVACDDNGCFLNDEYLPFIDAVPCDKKEKKFKFRHCKGCDFSNTNNVYNRLQIQKRIQNVVRIPSSLYQDNLSALNVYEKPLYINQTNQNQSSDRLHYHKQNVVIPSHCNTTKYTRTNCRPGASSPGGVGVDIKHNSYARYLNRIKGKGPYRRGVIPKEQFLPYVPFDLAKPVYGDKFVKLNIINRCNCLS